MTVKIIPYTFSGAVVKGGTFTVGYPAGTNKGSFISGKIRRLFVNQSTFVCPTDFTVSFGATAATITYNGVTPIASGTKATVEFDLPGEASAKRIFQHLPVGAVNTLTPVLVNFGSPLLAVTSAFISSATSTNLPNATTKTYTTATLGTAPLNGSSTTWINDVPRNVTVTATHNSSLVAMTVGVTGYDVYNQLMYELFTVTATGTSKTFTGKKAFYKITKVDLTAAGDATANTISVGFGSALGLPVFVGDIKDVLTELQDGLIVGGSQVSPIRLPWRAELASFLVGSAACPELLAPCAGVVSRLGVVTRATVTTGGAVTAKVGTTDIAGLSVTVIDTSAKGVAQYSTPTAGDSSAIVAKDSRIQVVIADAFDTAGQLEGFIEIIPTDLKSGSLSVGLSPNTLPTSTTNDVRGTYTPLATMDGIVGFSLMVALSDPTFIGSVPYHL